MNCRVIIRFPEGAENSLPLHPANCYIGTLPEGHCDWYVKLTTQIHLMLRLRMTAAISQTHCTLMV